MLLHHRPTRTTGYLRRTLVDGTLAGLLSLAVLAWRGRAELIRPAAPLNAPAHWFFGDESLREDGPSWRHTLTGAAVHQVSALFWGLLYAALQQRRGPASCMGAAADATAVTAVAALVDLRLVPERLTPGFQHRLSPPSVAAVYLAFAVGLAASCAWRR
jgi:hypothetical protein